MFDRHNGRRQPKASVRIAYLLWLVVVQALAVQALFQQLAHAQTTPLQRNVSQSNNSLSRLWHDVGIAEANGDPGAVRTLYKAIVDSCLSCPEQGASRWYLAAASHGLARATARLGDTLAARRAIEMALENEFWNFDIVKRDRSTLDVIGAAWFDSVSARFAAQKDSAALWHPQDPMIFAPKDFWATVRQHDLKILRDPELPDSSLPIGALRARQLTRVLDSIPETDSSARFAAMGRWFSQFSRAEQDSIRAGWTRRMRTLLWDSLRIAAKDSSRFRRPVIIALHGGNASYAEFASHWKSVADSINAFIITPPGSTRFSPIINGWEDSFDEVDAYVMRIVDSLTGYLGWKPRIYLAGFSQGAKTALQIGLVHPDRVRGVISIAGYFDQPLPEDLARQSASEGLRIYAMSGEYDSRAFRASIELAKKRAERAGLPFRYDVIPGMVHEMPTDLASRLKPAWNWLRAEFSVLGDETIEDERRLPSLR